MVDDLRAMVGKRLLFSVRYVDERGEPTDRFQACGIVTGVDELVTIEIPGADEPFTLPPEPDAFDQATPGHYHLHDTGETVVDPDYTSTWTVAASDDD